MYKIGIDPRKGGILMNIICSTTLCWIVSAICHHLGFNQFWCLFCAFLTAIHPELVRNSHELQRECLYLFFSGLFVLFLIIHINTNNSLEKFFSAFLVGAIGATAWSSRHEGWELLPIALLWQAYIVFIRKKNIKNVLEGVGCMVINILGWGLSLIAILEFCDYPKLLYFQIFFEHINRIRLG